MPTPCKVCAHPERGAIDEMLAQQEVNVSGVARRYGVPVASAANHRRQHLPDFLVAFTGEADAPSTRALHGEAQRLYLVTLDALAKAQAGVLTWTDKDGKQSALVSPRAITALLGEARKTLGMISALATADAKRGDEQHEVAVKPELERAIGEALARVMERGQQRALTTTQPIVDAVVVDDVDDAVDVVDGNGGVASAVVVGGDTPGPGAGVDPPPRAVEGPIFPATSPKTTGGFAETMPTSFPPDQLSGQSQASPDYKHRAYGGVEAYIETLPQDVQQHIRDVLHQHELNDQGNANLNREPWTGNPAASAEERRAAGWPAIAPIRPRPTEDRTSPTAEQDAPQ